MSQQGIKGVKKVRGEREKERVGKWNDSSDDAWESHFVSWYQGKESEKLLREFWGRRKIKANLPYFLVIRCHLSKPFFTTTIAGNFFTKVALYNLKTGYSEFKKLIKFTKIHSKF